MQRLPLPLSLHLEVFRRCYKAYTQRSQKILREKAEETECHIELMSQCYTYAAQSGLLHRIPVHEGLGSMAPSDFTKLYRGQLSSPSGKCRDVYDSIYSSAWFGICPSCLQRAVSQLDHYLCQAYYPAFAVDPQNLVPICGECNKSKLDMKVLGPSERTVHPYYDSLPDIWLNCIITESVCIVKEFSVSPHVSGDMADLLRFHLRQLKLDQLYRTHAASVLFQIRGTLERLHGKGNEAYVRDFLEDRLAEAERFSRNTWQSALFRALSMSDWFCSTGLYCIED